jgi:triacylglycerol esterase/lipase EstA (alpha/beta hydrolase family)
MDPDTALENMRAMIEKLRTRVRVHGDPHFVLAETVDAWEALDGWLSKGGYRPEDWKP